MRITRPRGVHTIHIYLYYIYTLYWCIYIILYMYYNVYTHMSSTTNLNYFCRMCVRVSLDRIHALVTAC